MEPLFQIVFILVAGTLCQVIGWRVKIPSILLLLVAGIVFGPITGILTPDAVFGHVLMPLVELAVPVILFEGGLSLKRTELGQVGTVVIRLVTTGTLVTWILLSMLAYLLLDLNGPVSTLLGAILVVTGPTVIIPMLRMLQTRMPVEGILRWEGILIDPIGVVLAVLVAEVCEAGIDYGTPWHIGFGMLISLAVGVILGAVGAVILRRTIGHHRVPDQFVVPVALSVLFFLVTFSNMLHSQSGLLTATVMGIFVASTKEPWVQTIQDFISHTQQMFIAILFLVLAARLKPDYVESIDVNLLLFVGAAILIVRPAATFIATFRTSLTTRERLAISGLAPRGIVSAALASSLGTSLEKLGIPSVQNIVPYTFATIIGTVAVYGLCSRWFFRALNVQKRSSEGVLIVGGNRIARAIGAIVQEAGFRVTFVDTNAAHVRRLRSARFEAHRGSILSDTIQEEINFEGLGNLLAFTENDEANSLAAAEFRHIFGAANVFQVAPLDVVKSKFAGRTFCNQELSLEKMEELWFQGYRPYVREVTKESESEASDSPVAPEYVLAEIDNARLFLMAHDNLRKSSKPQKQILFGPGEAGTRKTSAPASVQ